MNIKAIGFYIGHILWIEGVLLVPALLIALFRHEQSALRAIGITILILMLLSMALLTLGRRGPFWKRRRDAEDSRFGEGIHAREGFVITALGWIVISLFGALPFYLSGVIPGFINCWFETVSGFTTTGATILSEIESLPMSLLYWRSFTHWIGGMGVLVFLLAIIPLSKGNGETFHLLRAESPGPSVGKLTPTMRHTARLLYAIYVALTVIMIGFLLAGGMPLFDSIVHAFATAGTGGFSIKNASIAAYDSHYLQTVIAVFMVLFGVNFNVFYLILCKRASQALRSEELRVYLGILFGATVIIAFNTLPQFSSLGNAFHHSFFQVASIMTTTGFSTVDFNLWPELSRMILVALIIIGACAGSTGGGIKVARAIILWKSLKSEMQRMLRPRTVKVVCMDGKQLDDHVIRGVFAYMTAFIAVCLLSILCISIENYDMETTVTAVLTCIGNVGPGLSIVGPTGNFSHFSALSKLVLSANMLIGRLEIFPFILLFAPTTWKSRT